MNLDMYKEKVNETVIESMIAFAGDWEDCDFTMEDVESCRQLLYNYLEALDEMPDPTDDVIMEQVKTVVLALNELNENVDYSLIETEEREAIWEIIQTSAVDCGLQNYSDDITEEWRDW